jgi:D-glycero-beta-D-manno-heptose 1-phosphate adenylyltransferase
MNYESSFDQISSKIVNEQNAIATVKKWKQNGDKVVLTNGCFDLIHLGHVQYLSESKDLGDKLIVALNSSESVSLLKGQNRPINSEEVRAYNLAAMLMVDMVIIFDDLIPLQIIKLIEPDFLVKGGDYDSVEKIVGADYVNSYGGSVVTLPFLGGFSTTNIIKKITENE